VGLVDFARLTALMSRLSRPWQEDAPDARVVEDLDLVAGPGVFDLYHPARGAPRAVIVAVHGVTTLLGRDPRLIHFARSLARSGVACAVPSLDGLAAARWDAQDLDRLEAVSLEAIARTGRPGVGLIGFSYGGSYALVTAAREALAEQARFVIAIGAYHDLARLFAWYVETRHEDPQTEAQWDDRIYLHMVLARAHPELLTEAARQLPLLEDLLGRYCSGSSPEEKRRTFEQELRSLDLVAKCMNAHDPAVVAALSPAGNLGGLRCPVSQIHDPMDAIVPREQAEALHLELERLPGGERHGLLVTRLLTHVSLDSVLRLGELRRLFVSMAPIIRAM
jgi:pimeloyl-ACP methyl ester carboxylesterase